MAKSRSRFLCLDCKVDCGKIGEHYMLKDLVWFSVVASNKGMLCVGCIEGRLGRRLIPSDFNNSYVNGLGFGQIKSNRLLERLRIMGRFVRGLTARCLESFASILWRVRFPQSPLCQRFSKLLSEKA